MEPDLQPQASAKRGREHLGEVRGVLVGGAVDVAADTDGAAWASEESEKGAQSSHGWKRRTELI